jgi:hypothetical protein
MPGSPSASEKEEAQRAITLGLTDITTAETLQNAGECSKKKREQIRAEREERAREEREGKKAATKKCMLSLSLIHRPLAF